MCASIRRPLDAYSWWRGSILAVGSICLDLERGSLPPAVGRWGCHHQSWPEPEGVGPRARLQAGLQLKLFGNVAFSETRKMPMPILNLKFCKFERETTPRFSRSQFTGRWDDFWKPTVVHDVSFYGGALRFRYLLRNCVREPQFSPYVYTEMKSKFMNYYRSVFIVGSYYYYWPELKRSRTFS